MSNHLTDVHGLDYINRRKWFQEAELQPKVRVIIYPAKRNQGLIPSTNETPPSVQEEEKGTVVHQLSTPREVKKSLKSLPRGIGKVANNIKHYKSTADSIPEWFTLYETMKGQTQKKSLVTPPAVPVACDTKPCPISFTFSLLVLKVVLHLPFSVLSKLVLFKQNKMSLSDGYNYYSFQGDNGNYEDSEDSQSSQETDSFQEVTERLGTPRGSA